MTCMKVISGNNNEKSIIFRVMFPVHRWKTMFVEISATFVYTIYTIYKKKSFDPDRPHVTWM